MRSVAKIVPFLFLTAALPALAVEGHILIPFTTPVVTPITLTLPGHYVVTRNITGTPGGGPLITIAFPPPAAGGQHVEIDLNGFVLNNGANPGSPVIAFPGPAPRELVVRNGTLIGGSDGIAALGGARKVIVDNVQFEGNTGNGIHLSSVENVIIRRSVFYGSGAVAILVDSAAGPIAWQGTIEDNLIKQPGTGGIVLTAPAANRGTVIVRKNQLGEVGTTAANPGAINLTNMEPCLVTENTIRGVGGGGIFAASSEGCRYVSNVVSDTSSHGIQLDGTSQDNFVEQNILRGAFGDGIRIDGHRTMIRGNVMHLNGVGGGAGFGLHITAGATRNRIGGNSSIGNFGNPAAPCFTPSTEYCDETGAVGANTFTYGDNLMPGPATF